MRRPLCFVLMPFGKKEAGSGQTIDFDSVYNKIIKPAIESAGLDPIRADEEAAGGIIHKPMFERLVLCDYAVADLTTANANVFYELGVRHAVKPRTTILIFAQGYGRLPFDVAQLRALPYAIGKKGHPTKVNKTVVTLTEKIHNAKSGDEKDSPLYQLLEEYPNISHEKTDIFREQVDYNLGIKTRLVICRESLDLQGMRDLEGELADLRQQEAGVVIDLLLSYRAVSAWADMVALEAKVSPIVARTVLFQEQLAFAWNRLGEWRKAEATLKSVISNHGPSSETLGLLGRVYKDRWQVAAESGGKAEALGWFKKALNTYKEGFYTDIRDTYPGVNFVTLSFIDNPDSRDFKNSLNVVRFALEQKMANGSPDYWDHATRLELGVLGGEKDLAQEALADALASVREPWELETTANNLSMIATHVDDIHSKALIQSYADELTLKAEEMKG
ncbi:MAG: DUF4071 domain-containing protein [Alphaproteobacteria bacterium]|nr:MAG: DUF4071 domain-containing protein [Alphaproteobacteria bacterium]